MSTCCPILGSLVPESAPITHGLLNFTANFSENNSEGCLRYTGKMIAIFVVAKVSAVALIVFSALNIVLFPIVGALDCASNILKNKYKAAVICLFAGIGNALRSAASVVVITVALAVSTLYWTVFKHLKQETTPQEVAEPKSDNARPAAPPFDDKSQTADSSASAVDTLSNAEEVNTLKAQVNNLAGEKQSLLKQLAAANSKAERATKTQEHYSNRLDEISRVLHVYAEHCKNGTINTEQAQRMHEQINRIMAAEQL